MMSNRPEIISEVSRTAEVLFMVETKRADRAFIAERGRGFGFDDLKGVDVVFASTKCVFVSTIVSRASSLCRR